MNMKKTIAAIAAGSVAVSAMATTVSALEAKTLTYSLVQNIRQNDASGVVTATFPNLQLDANGKVELDILGANNGQCIVTITGYYLDDAAGSNSPIDTIVCTSRSWETGWSQVGQNYFSGDVEVTAVNSASYPGVPVGTKVGTIVLPVGFINEGKPLAESSRATINVSVAYKNLDASVGYAGALNDAIKAQTRGVGLKVYGTTGGTAATPDTPATPADIQSKSGSAKIRKESVLNAKIGTPGESVTFNYITNTEIIAAVDDGTVDKDGNKVTITATSGWYAGVTVANIAEAIDAKATEIAAAASAAAAKGIADAEIAKFEKADLDEYSIYGQTETGGEWIDVTAGADAVPGTGATPGTPSVTPTWMSNTNGRAYGWGAATEAAGGTSIAIPYRSSLKNSLYNYRYTNASAADGLMVNGNATNYNYLVTNNAIGGGDIFWKIGLAAADNSNIVSGGMVDDFSTWMDGSYTDQKIGTPGVTKFFNEADQIATNVKAVINDAIQNYSDVTFVFNTAAQNVKVWTRNDGTVIDYEYTTDGASAKEWDQWTNGGTWKQIIDYKAFGRHYWDRDTGYDANTIYINNDWLGNNLFEGALIINNNLTLSLGATDKFDWTATSLSFSWDAIQDAALTTNQYANYIQNMVLRTSSDWYWDNMQVVLGATEDEDVGTTSPVEAEEEELETEEPEVEVEPVDEPEVPAEPEPEPEPVAAPNPGTGNAPVALAVIPVALAAAAIVAKKRG